MSEGIQKVVVLNKESAWGTKAPDDANAREYRRVTSSFQGEKDAFASTEIRTDQQMVDSRHGTRRSTGALAGELSGGAYDELIAAALRRDFSAGATTGAVIVIASAVGTFTRSTGSFVTDGFNVGSVISVSGFTSAGNNGLFYIRSMTATVLTVAALQGQTQTVEAEGDSVTILEKGQKTFVPSTGHTDDSFTAEEYYPDNTISRTFLGEQVNTMAVSLSPNAMATINFDFLGKDAEAPTGTQYFNSAVAPGTEGTYAGQDGFCFIEGVANAKLTSFNFTLNANIQQEAVLFSSSIGAKARGKVMMTYDATVIFDADDFLGYFNNETEISVGYVLMSADNSEAFSIYFPRAKVNSATTDDGEKVIILSFGGEVLKYVGSAVGVNNTTVQIQDTTLA
jgi:hypothetical protein